MKKIVILHTDVSQDASEDELDCLRQAEAVFEALTLSGHDPVLMPFVPDLAANIDRLHQISPRAVFNLVETVAGKGSLVYLAPALLDTLNLPYTGCRTEAMFITSNKPLAKKMMHQSGVATPSWICENDALQGVPQSDTFIIKACWEEASVGLDEGCVVQSPGTDDLAVTIQRKNRESGFSWFAEEYIDGREFNIGLLAGDTEIIVLPAAEILFVDYPWQKPKILDYRSKWVEGSFEYEHTVRTFDFTRRDEKLISSMRGIALRCWELFDLRGYARIDFRVDKNGLPLVLEVNANPCLSPDAGFAAALARADISYQRAIDLLVIDCLK
jgi:D-alanine-D-alanine ligase